MAKISVLIPTYNDGDSIIETIESVINQSFTDWELLIMNDGSTDNTKNIIFEYVNNLNLNKKVMYYEQKNQDQLNAILNLLDKVTSKYLYVLHSDDLLPDRYFFENCVEQMDNTPFVDSLIGDLVVINKDSEVVDVWKSIKYVRKERMLSYVALMYGKNIYGDTGFHRAETYTNLIKENYLIWNTPFWINFTNNRINFLNVKNFKKPILKYRVHSFNYNKNIIGKNNVLNGELRTLISLLKNYHIPFFSFQRTIFLLLRKKYIRNLKLCPYMPVIYFKKPQKNKWKIIEKAIKSSFPNYFPNPWLVSLVNFYKINSDRKITIKTINNNDILYGKDLRLFTEMLLSNSLPQIYYQIFEEMNKGFKYIVVKNKIEKEKIITILRFLCISEVKLIIGGKYEDT